MAVWSPLPTCPSHMVGGGGGGGGGGGEGGRQYLNQMLKPDRACPAKRCQ